MSVAAPKVDSRPDVRTATPVESRLFPTRNRLPEDTRRQSVEVLNSILADLTDLYTQTKHAHWNVKGVGFIGMHKLLDELAEVVEGDMDKVAERATALGGVAFGTLRHAAAASRLTEFPADVHHTQKVAGLMADRYAEVSGRVRLGLEAADAADDPDTADLLTDVSRDLDQGMYLLEAHVQLDDGQPG